MKTNNAHPKFYKNISKIHLSISNHQEYNNKMSRTQPLDLDNEKGIILNRMSRNNSILNGTPNKQLIKSHVYTKVNSTCKKVNSTSPRKHIIRSIYSKKNKALYKKRIGPCIYKNNFRKTVSIHQKNIKDILFDAPQSKSTNSLLNNYSTNLKRETDNNYYYFRSSVNPHNQQRSTDFDNDIIFLNEKEFLDEAARMIQSNIRGYIFRIKLCNTLNKIDKTGSIFDILHNAFYHNGEKLWKQFFLILKKKTKLFVEKKFYNEFIINNENNCEVNKTRNDNISEYSLSNNFSKDNCISFNFLQKAKNSCFYLAEQLIKERDELKKELINIITKKNELEKQIEKYKNEDMKSKLRNIIFKKIEDSKKDLYFYKFISKTFSFKDTIEIKIKKEYYLKNIFNIVNRKKKELLMKCFYKFLYKGKIFNTLVNTMNNIITKNHLENKGINSSENRIEKIENIEN